MVIICLAGLRRRLGFFIALLVNIVMNFADRLRVAQGKPSILAVEILGEVVERFKVTLQDNGSVEQHRDDGLSRTCVEHYLPGEKHILAVLR